MKLLSVGGTRPQFVKMAIMSKAIEEFNQLTSAPIEHRLLHTGQHRDPGMSDIFFSELGMPKPQMLRNTPAHTPGLQTAIMLAGIEAEMINWKPDAVIAYGDTNSTLASALAAAKLHIPLIHVEAGLRSFNRLMQEEINRIVTDQVSDLLLCPTHAAVEQLRQEGLGDRAVFVGDIMLDAVEQFGSQRREAATLRDLPVKGGDYALLTLHRAEMTDDATKLSSILGALRQIDIPIVFPMHPRLRNRLAQSDNSIFLGTHVHVVEPVGYLEMLALQRNARFVMTDSGGLQKEAYFTGTPCLTLREETEWRETLHGGWNMLVGSDREPIIQAANALVHTGPSAEPRNLDLFGGGLACKRSVDQIVEMVRAA
ncbi:non-hydrolyzing UDP-N-acetylglucosamine 2-epimerase [Terriglobus sp. ADX1]|uniref:non-hydrolyzing UDP-N-acetylglucosamine 2-epimerase n=1 Tax=Terriglobus sp. ADX1 TaxID=2794063 RepID=UPI002FE67EA0